LEAIINKEKGSVLEAVSTEGVQTTSAMEDCSGNWSVGDFIHVRYEFGLFKQRIMATHDKDAIKSIK
jgi:hypothetical protein